VERQAPENNMTLHGRGCVKTPLPAQIYLHPVPQRGFFRNIAHNPKRVVQMLT
jgi:murein L,D-transpeptidase YcbB/YkuD